MHNVESHLIQAGFTIAEKAQAVHHYVLDDDADLASSLILVEAVSQPTAVTMPTYFGRAVHQAEIPWFYSRSVAPPYPRYIRSDGTPEFEGIAA